MTKLENALEWAARHGTGGGMAPDYKDIPAHVKRVAVLAKEVLRLQTTNAGLLAANELLNTSLTDKTARLDALVAEFDRYVARHQACTKKPLNEKARVLR